MAIQDKFNKTNVIYKITKDIDLGGGTLTIPEGCTLDFQGGSFSNGTIEGNNTSIQATLTKIFGLDIELTGTWNVSEAYPEWFGAIKNVVIDNCKAFNKALSCFDSLYLSPGTYYSSHIVIPSFKTIKGNGKQSVLAVYPTGEKQSGYLLTTEDGGSGITLSDFKLVGGNSGNFNDFLIGGIRLKSTSNSVNKQWDTRNTIKNVEILNCYAASLYIDEFHRGCDISNCWISGTTNVGIHCFGTDNTISECVISGSHNSGIILQTNNKLCNTKLFGCGASTELQYVYALDVIGSKCAISNVEIQQNYWGGCIVRGDNNYIQVVTDNNGSGNITDTINLSVPGSYNTIIATCANFTFHDDSYDRYYLATNWNTVGNNIIISGKHLSNNKTAILAPFVKDNICNHIVVNGSDITNERTVELPPYVDFNKYTQNGTGAMQKDKDGFIFKLTSSSAPNANSILSVIDIPISKIEKDGVVSAKMRFSKEGDVGGVLYPYCGIYVRYRNSYGEVKDRMENGIIISNLENGDDALLSVVCSLYHAGLDIAEIISCQLYIALRTKETVSNVEIYGYFRNIALGVKTTDDSLCSLAPISTRPINPIIGYSYLDTSLNKPIWWTGSTWVDATGTEV